MLSARTGFLLAAAVPLITAKGASGQDLSDLPPDVQRQLAELWQPWKFTGEAEVSTGYDSNIFLSAGNPLGGGFVRGGLDTRLLRLPTPTDTFSGYAFLTGDNTTFFSGSGGDRPHEAEWDSGIDVRWQPIPALEFSADGDGDYQDQVFDLSTTTADHLIAEMHDLSALGFLRARWHCWRGFWLEGEVQQQRDHVREFTEDFDQRGGAGRVGWSRPGRAEVSFTYAERRRDYFERTQYTAIGRSLAGTSLSFLQREGTLKGEVDWSLGGAWSATTTLDYLANRDNGPGYFNFDEKSAREELAWERANWRIALDSQAERFVFGVQLVGFGIAPTPRIVEDYDNSLRLERKLGAHWKVFAQQHWERNRTNDQVNLTGYRTNTTLAGAAFTY